MALSQEHLMNDKKAMNFNDLEQWLNERRVTAVSYTHLTLPTN